VFGISAPELLVLAVVAAIFLGPERLPGYAAQLARMIRELRKMAQGATEQVRSEMGPEFDDIDWRKLDPRQYDPRRIVRDALSDVWDPDDPLGLNGLTDEKPVSRGGPADVQANGSGTGSGRSRSAAERAAQAQFADNEQQVTQAARLAEARARAARAGSNDGPVADYDPDAT
jgi:sec-independent protein translocase protein TatB